MKRNPNGRQRDMRAVQMRQAMRSGRDHCISCHLRASYNVLARGMRILNHLAMRKRPRCNAAGACSDIGLTMSGNEPPQAENCECRLTEDLACAVMSIQGQLDLVLEKADRLALMVDRGSVLPEDNTRKA